MKALTRFDLESIDYWDANASVYAKWLRQQTLAEASIRRADGTVDRILLLRHALDKFILGHRVEGAWR